MKRTLQISNAIFFVITLVFNYLSITGIFNGNTMSSVSAMYQNLFTPAGYAFSIWGLIYLGLFGFIIYQGRSLFKQTNDDDFVLEIGWWFVISCSANSLWIFAWLYDFIGASVLIMVILLFSLLKIVIKTNMELADVTLKKLAFLWWPFSIYSGWITVALIANISAWLTKIEWNGFGISDVSWAIIMIIITGVVNIFMTWNRNMREFAIVGVWGLVAIALSNQDKEQSVVYAAWMTALIIFINVGIHAFRNRKSFLQTISGH